MRYADANAPRWAVVVPPNRPLIARQLWAEWLSTRVVQPASTDIRVDTIRAEGGDLLRYRVKGVEVLSIEDLAVRVGENYDGARSIVDEHRLEWGVDILSHLLVADLRRHTEAWFEVHGSHYECVEDMAAGLNDGDASVQNAIAISFVEDTGWWDASRQDLVGVWPQGLRNEVARQREIGSAAAQGASFRRPPDETP